MSIEFILDGKKVSAEPGMTILEVAKANGIEIPTLEGREKFTIPEATQTGTKFTLRGKGIKRVNSNGRGNLYVIVNIEVPKSLNSNQKELLAKFADACGESNYAKKSKFFKKNK